MDMNVDERGKKVGGENIREPAWEEEVRGVMEELRGRLAEAVGKYGVGRGCARAGEFRFELVDAQGEVYWRSEDLPMLWSVNRVAGAVAGAFGDQGDGGDVVLVRKAGSMEWVVYDRYCEEEVGCLRVRDRWGGWVLWPRGQEKRG